MRSPILAAFAAFWALVSIFFAVWSFILRDFPNAFGWCVNLAAAAAIGVFAASKGANRRDHT